MFKLGDEVRLKKGNTRMVVIGLTNDNEVIAKYDHGTYDYYSPVTDEDYQDPYHAQRTYIRPHQAFSAWDGPPAQRMHPMPKINYKVKRGIYKDACGTLLNYTSTGKCVLELEDGNIITVAAKKVSEIIPFTIQVKEVGNSCHNSYEISKDSQVSANDLLLSESGILYVVLRVGTECRHSVPVFTGTRLVQEPF